MGRRFFIGGNWKLNLAPPQAAVVAEQMRDALGDRSDVDLAVFPTALSIPAVLARLEGSSIEVGIQDVHTETSGAFTGANSAAMARAIGCTRALVGHSERRHVFGETDAQVRAKIETCLSEGLLPIVCLGETLDQRKAGRVDEIVHGQLRAALEGLEPDEIAGLVLAYEPVWAIGTGETATPEQAQQVHASLRSWLADHYPSFVADEIRIQYGGSVKPHNAAELLACEDIDGALVGGASLKAESFAGIIDAAS